MRNNPFRSFLGLLTIALAMAACSSGSGASSTTVSSTTLPPPPTTSPSTTEAMVVTTTTAPVTTTTLPPTTTTTVASTTTTTLPPFPPAMDLLEHGGYAWAVYLAVSGDFGDPVLTEAFNTADQYGYFAGAGDINCDLGGAQAIGGTAGDSLAASAVYFETVVDAAAFVVAYDARGHSVVGMGLVQTFCLD